MRKLMEAGFITTDFPSTISYFTRSAVVVLTLAFMAPTANTAPLPCESCEEEDPDTIFDVKYSQGAIIGLGPLSFGLSALPAEVNAQFILGEGSPVVGSVSPKTQYGLADVISANVSFGDATWNTLTLFNLIVQSGGASSLNYAFSPIDSATSTGSIVLNFPLFITGIDTASGAAFSYEYSESTQSIRDYAVPEPASLVLFGLGLAGLGYSRRKKA